MGKNIEYAQGRNERYFVSFVKSQVKKNLYFIFEIKKPYNKI